MMFSSGSNTAASSQPNGKGKQLMIRVIRDTIRHQKVHELCGQILPQYRVTELPDGWLPEIRESISQLVLN